MSVADAACHLWLVQCQESCFDSFLCYLRDILRRWSYAAEITAWLPEEEKQGPKHSPGNQKENGSNIEESVEKK